MVQVEYLKVEKGRASAKEMKRQRSWGDKDLLGSNTEDTTDNSDESLSLRSSWSLVSQR